MAGCYEDRSLLLAQRLRPLHQPLLHPAALTLIKLRLRHRRLHVRLGVESASLWRSRPISRRLSRRPTSASRRRRCLCGG